MASYSTGVNYICFFRLTIAVVLFLGGGVMFTLHSSLFHVVFGIWSGSWIFMTGLLGCMSTKNQNTKSSTCYIATFMSCSIISTVVVGTSLIIIGVKVNASTKGRFRDYTTANLQAPFYMTLSGLELILSVCSSIICCHAVSSAGRHEQNAQTQEEEVTRQTGQVMYVQRGQVPMVVPASNAPRVMQAVLQEHLTNQSDSRPALI